MQSCLLDKRDTETVTSRIKTHGKFNTIKGINKNGAVC